LHPLIELARSRPVNQVSGFAEAASQVDPAELASHYRSLQDGAPKRHSVGKKYFVGHTGIPSSGSYSNRSEEHLAIALFNGRHGGSLRLPDGSVLNLIDYQVPLKARRDDQGVGKVDLMATIGGTDLAVVELKHVADDRSTLGDTPLRAFLEALGYAAIVQANLDAIGSELGMEDLNDDRPPQAIILATPEYWQRWVGTTRAGDWQASLARLCAGLYDELDLVTRWLELRIDGFTLGLSGQQPQLAGEPRLVPVDGLPS
jgi:hypothetical protein